MPDPAHPPSPLERVALEMASSLDLEAVLAAITGGLRDELDAALVRLWLLGPGDLCEDCFKAAACHQRDRCLHLRASAGLSTNVEGEYRRVPLGGLKIGRIAQGWGPMSTNDAYEDERLPNKTWLRTHGLVAFAGYPLLYRDELLGVLALFRRHPLTALELERLPLFASQAAVAVKTAQLFDEVRRQRNRYRDDSRYLQEEITHKYDAEAIPGDSPAFRKVLDSLRQVAPTNATVLIQGETGTGKELLARAVHRFSRRAERPLVKVNCAAIPPTLIESEFFGHERGAFTGATSRRIGRFELADGGTIFLDEVGELPLELQSKLLRVLQEREFERVGGSQTLTCDVRVIAATNRGLQAATRDGTFRSDLYYRLNVFPLRIPPLRERPEDVERLAWHFARRFAREMGRSIDSLSTATLDRLRRYDWPGNVRELENVIERAVILSTGTVLQIDDETLGVTRPDGETDPAAPPPQGRAATPDSGDDASLEAVQRRHILTVLDETDGVVEGPRGAAARLGLRPSTLRSLMRRLDVRRDG